MKDLLTLNFSNRKKIQLTCSLKIWEVICMNITLANCLLMAEIDLKPTKEGCQEVALSLLVLLYLYMVMVKKRDARQHKTLF